MCMYVYTYIYIYYIYIYRHIYTYNHPRVVSSDPPNGCSGPRIFTLNGLDSIFRPRPQSATRLQKANGRCTDRKPVAATGHVDLVDGQRYDQWHQTPPGLANSSGVAPKRSALSLSQAISFLGSEACPNAHFQLHCTMHPYRSQHHPCWLPPQESGQPLHGRQKPRQ